MLGWCSCRYGRAKTSVWASQDHMAGARAGGRTKTVRRAAGMAIWANHDHHDWLEVQADTSGLRCNSSRGGPLCVHRLHREAARLHGSRTRTASAPREVTNCSPLVRPRCCQPHVAGGQGREVSDAQSGSPSTPCRVCVCGQLAAGSALNLRRPRRPACRPGCDTRHKRFVFVTRAGREPPLSRFA